MDVLRPHDQGRATRPELTLTYRGGTRQAGTPSAFSDHMCPLGPARGEASARSQHKVENAREPPRTPEKRPRGLPAPEQRVCAMRPDALWAGKLDLGQFIRVNGTVVGALAGLLIHTLSQLFL
nr:hypothetical protein GCM10020241_40460 [Streptoalloteichus tenebrarius]